MTRLLLLVILALAAAPSSAQTRPTEEPEEPVAQTGTAEDRPFDDLIAHIQKDFFRVTTLIQIVPHVPFEDSEGNEAGFDVAAAWLGIGGRLGKNIGYYVRGAFEREPSLLDAYVSYGSDDVRGIVGRQKVPFSDELLMPAGELDFIRRARAVRFIVPGRSTGAVLDATPGGGPLRLRAGVFNATTRLVRGLNPESFGGQSDRGGALLAGHAQAALPVSGGSLVVGASAAYNTKDTSERFDVPQELLLGADARLRLGRVLVAGEYLHSDLGRGLDVRDGGYATLGYDVTGVDRVLARFDVYQGSQEVLLGYTRVLTRAARVQLNVIIPADDGADSAGALANFQLGF